jgi:SPP1 gp7 family putative phage head morphogenesis protein
MHSPRSTLALAKKTQYALQSNAGLDAAEAQDEFSTFIRRVTRTIRTQVKRFTDDKKLIEDLLFLLGKDEPNTNLLSFLSKTWVSFEAIYEELFGKEALIEFYIWAGTQGGSNALERMGIGVTFILRNDAVTEYLKERANYLIQSVDDTTKDQLVRLIQEAREKGLTNFQIAEAIEDRFKEITPARAEAIARTELAEAFNAVELQSYQRNGVQKMRWVTVLDERVCTICQPLHNTEVNIGENFPGIGSPRPPAHVNCRCFLEEVVEGVALRGNALVWAGE